MSGQIGFMLYQDQFEPIAELSLEQKGMLLDALFRFNGGEKVEISDLAVRVAFGYIKSAIVRNQDKMGDLSQKRRDAVAQRRDRNAPAAESFVKTDSTNSTNETFVKTDSTNSTNETFVKTDSTNSTNALKQEQEYKQEFFLNARARDIKQKNFSQSIADPPGQEPDGGALDPHSGDMQDYLRAEEDFNAFWHAFDLPKGKREANSAWHNIAGYTPELGRIIIAAARQEAAEREAYMARGQNPKRAAGWLRDRRWEDFSSPPPRDRPPEKREPTQGDAVPASLSVEEWKKAQETRKALETERRARKAAACGEGAA